MSNSWKSVLYDYVNHRNKLELELRADLVRPFVSDERYIDMLGRLLKRVKERTLQSGRIPTQCETRARLSRLEEETNKVTADLWYRKRIAYGPGSREERIEKERITLMKRKNNWTISQIETPVPERTPQKLSNTAKTPIWSHDESEKIIPQPLLTLPKKDPPRNTRYDRLRAVQYADTWWNSYNPEFVTVAVDCTNFVSQCLFAGGIPMNYTGSRGSGWWHRGYVNGSEQWSYSWTVSNALLSYVTRSGSGLRGTLVDSPAYLTLGDIIIYDWDGDGNFTHSTIVTAFDPRGLPLVNAHTYNAYHRYWEYTDSPAWTEKTQYRFIRIADSV